MEQEDHCSRILWLTITVGTKSTLILRRKANRATCRVIIAAAFRLHYLAHEFRSSDPTFEGVSASICTQIDMSYAIIATTLPCLRPFMIATSTQAPIGEKKSKGSKYVTGSPKQSIILSSLATRLRTSDNDEEVQVDVTTSSKGIRGWANDHHNASVTTQGDQQSVGSNESRQMIIRKDVEFEVTYEDQQLTQIPSHKSEPSKVVYHT